MITTALYTAVSIRDKTSDRGVCVLPVVPRFLCLLLSTRFQPLGRTQQDWAHDIEGVEGRQHQAVSLSRLENP